MLKCISYWKWVRHLNKVHVHSLKSKLRLVLGMRWVFCLFMPPPALINAEVAKTSQAFLEWNPS